MERTAANPGVDRLSALPDAILHSILSLLPVLDAATTTVLSRRWRRLFHSIPDLTLDDDSFNEDGALGDFFSSPSDWFDAFEDILSSRDAPIRRCVIASILENDYADLLDRIAFCLRALGVSDLSLVCDEINNKYAVSPVFLSFETLRRLYISFCRLEVPLEITGLSLLRQLLLTHVVLAEDDVERLVSHCPCLERLQLLYCQDLRKIVIRSNSLSVLELANGGQISISVEKAPSLLRARIAIHNYFRDDDYRDDYDYAYDADDNAYVIDDDADEVMVVEEEEEEEVVVAIKEGSEVDRFLKLLEDLSQVESLRLSFREEVVQRLREDVVPLPKKLPHQLQNLKKVHLQMPFSDGYLFSVLSCLLKSSPNVEELVIYEYLTHGITGIAKAEYWRQFKTLECTANWPACVALHVRFDRLEHWIGFIKLLVMNAYTIRKMIIAYSTLPKEESEAKSAFENACRELLLLRRASPHVALELATSPEDFW